MEPHVVKNPSPVTPSRPTKKLLYSFFILVSFGIGFFLGMYYAGIQHKSYPSRPNNLTPTSYQKMTVANPSSQPQITLPAKQCKVYSEEQKMDFIYNKYTVKPGDTLLSISESQLGSTSRISDIVYVNMKKYPGLSIQNAEIEPGWIFYLPRPFIKHILIGNPQYASYQLPTVLSAQIVKINANSSWSLTWGEHVSGVRSFSSDTPFIGKAQSDYKVGDCVTIVEAEANDVIEYGVFPQI